MYSVILTGSFDHDNLGHQGAPLAIKNIGASSDPHHLGQIRGVGQLLSTYLLESVGKKMIPISRHVFAMARMSQFGELPDVFVDI